MAEPQTVEAAARVTDPCPECQVQVPIPGRASAAMILGQHRAREHGYVSPKRAQLRDQAERRASGEARPRGRPRREESGPERVTPLHIMSEVGEAAGAGKKQAPPNAKDLTNGLAKVIGYLDIGLTSMMVEGDPRILAQPPDQQDAIHDEMVNLIAMEPDDAKALAGPFARMAAGTKINKKYGRRFIDNIDGLDAIVIFIEVMRTKRRYLSERHRWEAERAGPPPGAFDTPEGPQPRPQPGQPGGYPKSPAGERGVVVTPDMIASLRANGTNGHGLRVIPGAGPDGN